MKQSGGVEWSRAGPASPQDGVMGPRVIPHAIREVRTNGALHFEGRTWCKGIFLARETLWARPGAERPTCDGGK